MRRGLPLGASPPRSRPEMDAGLRHHVPDGAGPSASAMAASMAAPGGPGSPWPQKPQSGRLPPNQPSAKAVQSGHHGAGAEPVRLAAAQTPAGEAVTDPATAPVTGPTTAAMTAGAHQEQHTRNRVLRTQNAASPASGARAITAVGSGVSLGLDRIGTAPVTMPATQTGPRSGTATGWCRRTGNPTPRTARGWPSIGPIWRPGR
jgi:hypothetical protein